MPIPILVFTLTFKSVSFLIAFTQSFTILGFFSSIKPKSPAITFLLGQPQLMLTSENPNSDIF